MEGSTKGGRLLAQAAKIQTPLDLVLSHSKASRVAYHSFRSILGSIGALLVVEAIIRLLLPEAHNYAGHLTEDVASFEFGVGLGALAAGIRPQFAWMMRFILTPSALLLIVTAIVGILQHQTTAVIELQHLPVILGAISANAIVILSRPHKHQVNKLTIVKSKMTALRILPSQMGIRAILALPSMVVRSFIFQIAPLAHIARSQPVLTRGLAVRRNRRRVC